MAKHTPGPWEISDWKIMGPIRPHPQSRKLGVEIQTRTLIAHISCPNYTEQEANARLIAAAPDLLQALEYQLCPICEHTLSMHATTHDGCQAVPNNDPCGCDGSQSLSAIAAIKKAR